VTHITRILPDWGIGVQEVTGSKILKVEILVAVKARHKYDEAGPIAQDCPSMTILALACDCKVPHFTRKNGAELWRTEFPGKHNRHIVG